MSAATPPQSTKAKGDLLEDVIERLCAGFLEKKVTRNARLPGRHSLTDRDIDVLIEGRFAIFDMRIAIESKNYNDPVGVEKVEAFCTKLKDVEVHTGVMVSTAGFTEPARNTGAANNIQLFQVYDQSVSEQALWVPVGLVQPEPSKYSVSIPERGGGAGFSMPVALGPDGPTVDFSRLIFLVGDQRRSRGDRRDGLAFEDIDKPNAGVSYCELAIEVIVAESRRRGLAVYSPGRRLVAAPECPVGEARSRGRSLVPRMAIRRAPTAPVDAGPAGRQAGEGCRAGSTLASLRSADIGSPDSAALGRRCP